jgi:hypothetical protein
MTIRTAAATAARREKFIKLQIARAVATLRQHAPDLLSAKARKVGTDGDH